MAATLKTRLPTQDELPYDDGEPLETPRHRKQMNLLIHAIQPWLWQKGSGYTGGNMFVYFSPDQVLTHDFKGPDFYVALDVPWRERKSWLVWEEGKAPDVIIELLSSSTAAFDKGAKKLVYQDRLRAQEYYWFDPENTDDFAGFSLQDGVYQPLSLDSDQRLVSPCLQLSLVRWFGTYDWETTTWLRWATLEGELLLTETESAQQDLRLQTQRAEAEAQRADRLQAKLRELGIDPDN